MNNKKMDFWIENGLNVLMTGKHGVGKTARVLEAFNRNKLNWLYFSASTLDPWVDFIGVPKERISEDGEPYLDLVRPKHWANDEIEAIFLDEYNRAHKKVRNAVMELIQFKSINGKKFNNLKMVWAAINPDDDNDGDENALQYDVEPLDPAQKDRFHICIDIPYKPERKYFSDTHGEEGVNAVDWWNDLTNKQKDLISPRRLDYLVQMFKLGGSLRDVAPPGVNISKLVQELSQGSYKKNMMEAFSTKDPAKAASFIKIPNNYDNTIEEITKKRDLMDFFFPHIDDEKITALVSSRKDVVEYLKEKIEEKEEENIKKKDKKNKKDTKDKKKMPLGMPAKTAPVNAANYHEKIH